MKRINIAIICGLIFAITLSFARFDALCQDIRDNVFRLHIKANSDSSDDQRLKLLIRDAILAEEGKAFGSQENLAEAIKYATNNTDTFEQIANRVIIKNGYDYSVKVTVGKSYFENRKYEDFTLPAGEYEALNITIGEGQGKNWWCVMFPAVCVGASGDLKDSVCEDSDEIAKNAQKYKIKFKTVEIYEDLKKIFTKSKK